MSTSIDKFLGFWAAYNPVDEPYVHPQDVAARNLDWIELALLPVPVIGDLRTAEVVICMLNPGLDETDLQQERPGHPFREAVASNLRQTSGHADYPFFYMDERFRKHAGASYWIGGAPHPSGKRVLAKLRGVSEKFAAEFSLEFQDAVRFIAQRVAVLQQLPYHSRTLRQRGLLADLPSCNEARRLLCGLIEEQSKLVVVPRAVKEWGCRQHIDSELLVVYRPDQGAAASLSPATAGGRAILRKLRSCLETAGSLDGRTMDPVSGLGRGPR